MLMEPKNQKVFLMEALWPPFQPMYIKTKETIDSGIAGRILHLNARFGFQAPYNPTIGNSILIWEEGRYWILVSIP